MEILGASFVGSKAVTRGKTFHGWNPALGKPIDPAFHEASPEDADEALRLAAAAAPELRARSAESRATFLESIAESLLGLGDVLLERAGEETGLPPQRLAGERARTVGQWKLFAALVREGSWVNARVDRGDPARKPAPKPDIRRMLVPMGPVAVFGASNFPLAFSVAGGDTASALSAGNPVVAKAHPGHPGTSELAARAIIEAARRSGMPEGTFSLLQGAGNEIGLALVKHPLTRAAGFTGSLRGGRALFDAACARPSPIPLHAEMGSINPVFVLPEALRDRAEAFAEGLAQSVTLGVGQFCTNPGLVLGIEGEGLDRLRKTLAERIAASPPGVMLHPGIREGYEAGASRLEGIAGVRLEARSGAPAEAGKNQAAAAFFTADAATFLARSELSEEVFGPSTIVVRCRSSEELEEIARKLEGSLTATVHGTPADLARHARLVSIIEDRVGRLVWNGYPTGVEVGHAVQHGGPYPATTDPRFTSVGTAAILRFARPVCWQDWPDAALPEELRNANPRGIWRLVDGERTRAAL